MAEGSGTGQRTSVALLDPGGKLSTKTKQQKFIWPRHILDGSGLMRESVVPGRPAKRLNGMKIRTGYNACDVLHGEENC